MTSDRNSHRQSPIAQLLLLGGLLALPSSASAGPTILLESYVGARPPEAARYVEQLVAAMEGEQTPLHGAPLRQLIESRLSRGPGRGLDAAKLRAAVEEGGRLFIEGEFGQAIRQLEAARAELVQKVAAVAADQSLRGTTHRALLFLAHAYLRSDRGEEATLRIGEAIRSFPDRDLSLVQMRYGPELVALYRKVRSELARQGRGTLVVNTEPPGCLVFVDERFVGVSPARVVDLYPGSYRVFVRSHELPGRVHRVMVGKGEQTLKVRFSLDSRLRSEPYVGFRFPDPASLAREEGALASELGQELEAASVLVVGLRQHEGHKALVGTTVSPLTGQLRTGIVVVEPTPPSLATLRDLAQFLLGAAPGPGIIVPHPAPSQGGSGFFSARAWKWVTLGLAAGALAAGITLLALDGRGTCDSPDGARCPEKYNTVLPGAILTAAGGLAAGGSGFLFYWDHRRRADERPTSAALLPWIGAGAGLRAVISY